MHAKLEQLDKCVTDQIVDGGTGTTIPEVGDPRKSRVSGAVLNRKRLKGCFDAHMVAPGEGTVDRHESVARLMSHVLRGSA